MRPAQHDYLPENPFHVYLRVQTTAFDLVNQRAAREIPVDL
jgi:hypothetical protein